MAGCAGGRVRRWPGAPAAGCGRRVRRLPATASAVAPPRPVRRDAGVNGRIRRPAGGLISVRPRSAPKPRSARSRSVGRGSRSASPDSSKDLRGSTGRTPSRTAARASGRRERLARTSHITAAFRHSPSACAHGRPPTSHVRAAPGCSARPRLSRRCAASSLQARESGPPCVGGLTAKGRFHHRSPPVYSDAPRRRPPEHPRTARTPAIANASGRLRVLLPQASATAGAKGRRRALRREPAAARPGVNNAARRARSAHGRVHTPVSQLRFDS